MKSIGVNAIVDSARYFGLPLHITVLTIFVTLIDGYDLQTMSFVAPELVSAWGVDRASLAPALTGSLIGMALGSILLGWLGDRIGRRRSYAVCVGFLFAGSLLCARASGLWDLFAWRVLTGIGLGGVTPLAATLVAEWTPVRHRSVAVACAIVAIPLGGMLGAQVANAVIPVGGWRMVFYIGAALPLLFSVITWFAMPESPSYLAQHPRRSAELARTLNRLLGEKRFDGTESFHVEELQPPPGNWLAIVMGPALLRTTLLLWIAFACNTLALYSYVNWLPTLITAAGLPRAAGLHSATFFNFGGFFGAVGGAVLIGQLGSRRVGAGLALLGALATIVAGAGLSLRAPVADALFFILMTLAGVAVNGMQSFLYTVSAHSYPTRIRGVAVGFAQTVSRVGGVLSSGLGAAYFALRPAPPVGVFFYAIALVMLVVSVGFYFLRTHIPATRR